MSYNSIRSDSDLRSLLNKIVQLENESDLSGVGFAVRPGARVLTQDSAQYVHEVERKGIDIVGKEDYKIIDEPARPSQSEPSSPSQPSESIKTPLHVVNRHRLLYRNYYMVETLKLVEDLEKDNKATKATKPIRLPAFDGEGGGYENCYIIVQPQSQKHPDILASNYIIPPRRGKTKIGIININPMLCEFSKVRQKLVLAEEWIEVFLAFEDTKLRSRRIAGKEDAVVLFNSLRRKAYWQDSEDFVIKLREALRQLTASSPSIKKVLLDKHGITIDGLKQKIKDEPKLAEDIILKFVENFSKEKYVDIDLVYDRLQEELYNETNSGK
jgi:hypothetical protein